jgi:hypothetical protein
MERDVVNEFHDNDGFADTGPAEETDLSTLTVWLEQIDNLDSRLEDFGLSFLVFQLRRGPVNRIGFLGLNRPFLIDGLTEHVHQTAERFTTNRNGDRRTGVLHIHPSS